LHRQSQGSKEANPIAALVFESSEEKNTLSDNFAAFALPIDRDLFRTALIENNRIKSSSRALDLLIAFTVHFVVISIPILAGLYFTDTLNMKEFQSTFQIAPPPPPPPPPVPAVVVVKSPGRRVFENAGKLVAPSVIPKNVAEIKEAPLPPDMDGSRGVSGGVPGGVAGGSMGGVIGGVIGGLGSTVAPAPLAPKENRFKAPIRVGGHIREPKLLFRENPTYPPLARQTHLEGMVVIDAILDERGNVVEAKVTSGPALLIQSALDAVKRSKYEPTYLNDQPISVELNVTVTFRLAH
jgi:protein TonB